MVSKGNLAVDGILMVVILCALALFGLVFLNIMNDINDDVQADSDLSTSAKTLSNDVNTLLPGLLDYMFLFVILGLFIFLVIISFFLDTHPVFYILTILLLVGTFFVIGTMQDLYTEFSGDSELSSFTTQMPITHFIMQNFFVTFTVMILMIAVLLFAKSRGGGGL